MLARGTLPPLEDRPVHFRNVTKRFTEAVQLVLSSISLAGNP